MQSSAYEVIIIGGGVTGAAIARELSRYTLRVALLEKEEELAFGVSKSNSGIIHPGTQHPPNLLKARLCVQGNRLIRIISRELGVDFKEVGELIVAFEKADIPRLHKIQEDARKLGVPRVQLVDRSWLKVHEPNLNPLIPAALFVPSAGIISPFRLVYDLSENAVKNGVEVFTGTKVETIVRTGMGFELSTSRGMFKAKYLINCAGLYADELAKMCGIEDFTIVPRKGEEFILDKKRAYLTAHLIFPLPSTTSKGILVMKTADGNPMVGPTAEEIFDKEDLSTSEEGLQKVLAGARSLIPAINADDIIAYFAGLRPCAGEDFIIRHEEKAPGMITVAGIQSPGLTAAPAIALLVKRLLISRGLRFTRKFNFHGHRKKTIHLFAAPFSRAKGLIKKDPAYGDIVCRCEMVSAKEIKDAINRGAVTLDGVKFRTRAQSGRCHGGFCTTRIMKLLAEESGRPLTQLTKRGEGSEIVRKDRAGG